MGDPELLARSLSNLAKSHAAKGNFDAAVTCWSEAQPNITDRVEQSWLQHEMGRAHLEMGKADEALECGLAAERAANETGIKTGNCTLGSSVHRPMLRWAAISRHSLITNRPPNWRNGCTKVLCMMPSVRKWC